jgi:NADH-quinone oxidoreductase subunit E
VQINDDYFEDLNSENMAKILADLKDNKPIKIGSQTGRQCSKPLSA